MPPPASQMLKQRLWWSRPSLPALDHRRAAEFAAPDDDRVLQQAALLEIRDQRGAGLVGVEGVLLDAGRQVAVLVPGFVEELHEADAALDEPPGEQAVAGEVRVLGGS